MMSQPVDTSLFDDFIRLLGSKGGRIGSKGLSAWQGGCAGWVLCFAFRQKGDRLHMRTKLEQISTKSWKLK